MIRCELSLYESRFDWQIYLIIGLGYRHGSTSKVQHLIHESGSQTRVAISTVTEATIDRHLAEDHKAEVLVFHNNPPNPLNRLLDNVPIASDQDRRTWLANMLNRFRLIKAWSGGGRFLCYIGENGFVREFRTPQLLEAVRLLAAETNPRNRLM
jgi:hypothetical protein